MGVLRALPRFAGCIDFSQADILEDFFFDFEGGKSNPRWWWLE
jgi:hypothetical protein